MTKSVDEALDEMSDTIGFLLARIDRDTDRAMAIVDGDALKINTLLMGMTDLAMALTMTISAMTGMEAKRLVETMAMAAKVEGPEFMKRRRGL